MRLLAVLFALLLPTLQVRAEPPQFEDRAGDVYEIRLESASQTSGERSSGSSRDISTLAERVIGLRDGGIELEFDLPDGTSAEERARSWEFPARVLKSPGKPLQLLNAPELETRVHAWLASGGMTEAACGRWIFTWTAIKIECDPHSILHRLEPLDFRLADLRDGAPYSEAGTMGLVPLRAVSVTPAGATFVAEMEIDPETVRQGRAAADVIVAEISGQPPLPLEDARRTHALERISATIVSTLETDSTGRLTRPPGSRISTSPAGMGCFRARPPRPRWNDS